ncbi:hypothetical protein [Peribacillus simplex]|nr:hypothetical protein [Peribacillus simplex]
MSKTSTTQYTSDLFNQQRQEMIQKVHELKAKGHMKKKNDKQEKWDNMDY